MWKPAIEFSKNLCWFDSHNQARDGRAGSLWKQLSFFAPGSEEGRLFLHATELGG